MEIVINQVPTPMFNEFTVFEKLNTEKLIEEKKIIFIASNETKTRVHTSVKIGKAQKGVNWKVDGFKTHEKEHRNFFTYDVVLSNYFVVSKKQSINEYFDYIKGIINNLLDDNIKDKIDVLEVEFINRFKNWK